MSRQRVANLVRGRRRAKALAAGCGQTWGAAADGRALAGGGRDRLATGLAGREGEPEAALAQVQAEQAT